MSAHIIIILYYTIFPFSNLVDNKCFKSKKYKKKKKTEDDNYEDNV